MATDDALPLRSKGAVKGEKGDGEVEVIEAREAQAQDFGCDFWSLDRTGYSVALPNAALTSPLLPPL